MSYNILFTSHFLKAIKQLSKKYPSIKIDLQILASGLEINLLSGTPLGSNFYKIRLAISSKGKGKSGGARVITYVLVKNQEIVLVDIYDKSERSTVDIAYLLRIIKEQGI